ncbi:MAG: Na/Pi cotransporter family protein [Desulfuromusa sp.]|nr:Na/Pi cotransporter family protein [Desulfuromusa sp.]
MGGSLEKLVKRIFTRLFLIFLLLGFPFVVVAADFPQMEIVWGSIIMGVFGGLALFLLGMEQMTDALKAAAGTNLKMVLERLTANRFSGAIVGALVTAVIQSSSVTTVLVVGFVSAGLMTLSQSIGVIMGANIGTTITAQIVAFKITSFALAFIAVGFATLFLGRQEKVRQYGKIVLGLGMVFFGMSIMSDAMSPLQSYPPFFELMVRMENPMIGIFVGGLFTALVQSSSATTGIVIVLASQGFVTLPAGIALALGANVGTCVTAMLASIGKPRAAVRAAVVHVIFNLVGVLVWVGFIDQLASLAVACSPAYSEISGMARLAAEAPRQIANANTLFNIANTLIFIGFTPFFGKLVTRLLPEKPRRLDQPIITPKYLDDHLLDTPSAALNVVRMEIGHLGSQVLLMMSMARSAVERQSAEAFREIEKADDAADILHEAVIEYLNRIGKRQLTEEQSQEYYGLTQSADTLESIGDILETDLSGLGVKMIQNKLQPSQTMKAILETLHGHVYLALESAVKAVVDKDQLAAQDVLALRKSVNEAVETAFRREVKSLAQSDLKRLETLHIEFEMTDKLKQIYSLSKRIARLFVPREV